jgi:hypothetical protein
VGKPHLPISIALRENATICPQVLIDDGHVAAEDHDFHCVNFTPSVNLIVDAKAPRTTLDDDHVLQSVYRGIYHV